MGQRSVPLTHLNTSHIERERHQERTATLERHLAEAGLSVMPSPSHIVPLRVGDPPLWNAACDKLLQRHRAYAQPINYPTMARGTERLRLIPSLLHSDADMEALVAALSAGWTRLTVRRAVLRLNQAASRCISAHLHSC